MKAVILAAGEGRRLRPLTNLRPKPMIPIANRPLLEHVVKAVSDAGIDEIVLVIGYKKERIQSHFGDGDDWEVDIEYAVQEKQLGTGHAVLQAEEYIDDDFLVMNGDRIIESRLVEQLAQKHGENGGAVMAVTSSDEPSEYGVVELQGERVVGIREKPPAYETQTNLINAGVYGFSSSIFDEIRKTETREDGEITLTSAIENLVDDGDVSAVRSRGIWIDVSYLWDILSVNSSVLDKYEASIKDSHETARVSESAELSSSVLLGRDTRIGPNASVLGGCSIGDNVSIGANAVVSNSVILPDSSVGEGAVVKDCVVAGNTRIGPNTTVEGGFTDVVVEGSFYENVRLGSVIGDNVYIGAGVVFEPGSVVGNGSSIGTGTTVSGRIEPDSDVRRG